MALTGSRAAATATTIEEAALDLALDRGYEHVTVDMICEVAGISQRTFFNHFPTKDDALLGRAMPRVDERAARQFILGNGPVLLDALALIPTPEGETPPRIADRMRVIATSPTLLARQMERISAIEAELREVVALRLGRDHPEQPSSDHHHDAVMITHLLAGVMRFLAAGEDEAPAASIEERLEHARSTLERILHADR